MEFYLLIFTVICFISYLFFIVKKYGVLDSISDSYYKMKSDKIMDGALFTFFTWSIGLPVIIIGSTPLMFFAGSFICFVGAASAFKDLKMTRNVHYIGAFGGIFFGFLSMVLDFQQYFITIAMLLITINILVFKIKNKIWWIEVTAFILIILGLYLKI